MGHAMDIASLVSRSLRRFPIARLRRRLYAREMQLSI
jgi:hypothetical protein